MNFWLMLWCYVFVSKLRGKENQSTATGNTFQIHLNDNRISLWCHKPENDNKTSIYYLKEYLGTVNGWDR